MRVTTDNGWTIGVVFGAFPGRPHDDKSAYVECVSDSICSSSLMISGYVRIYYSYIATLVQGPDWEKPLLFQASDARVSVAHRRRCSMPSESRPRGEEDVLRDRNISQLLQDAHAHSRENMDHGTAKGPRFMLQKREVATSPSSLPFRQPCFTVDFYDTSGSVNVRHMSGPCSRLFIYAILLYAHGTFQGTFVVAHDRQYLNVAWSKDVSQHDKNGRPISMELWTSGVRSWPGGGPEGAFYRLGALVPLHWYVYSSSSAGDLHVKFGELVLHRRDKVARCFVSDCACIVFRQDLTARATVHMEKNWGAGFPARWIWAQASDEQRQLILAGGDVLKLDGRGRYAVDSLLLRWRGDRSDLTWTPVDSILNPIRVRVNDACAGRLEVEGSKRGLGIYVKFIAPMVCSARVVLCQRVKQQTRLLHHEQTSFVTLRGPTAAGFVPYCDESYRSKLTVTIRNVTSGEVIERWSSVSAALEFGGAWRCDEARV